MSESLSEAETREGTPGGGSHEHVGPYKILQRIGEGGFGSVYEAEQEHPVKRRVALKVIKLGMDTEHVIARFEAERQALAMMDHPHIARVLDAGATAAGRPYFVMELVRGDLDWIVMKCLEKDRTRRYDTASNLAADVQHHLDHEPIAARPPSRLYRFGKLVRRNKGAFAALAAIVLVLCAGVGVSVTQALRARRGEASANAALAELRDSAPVFAAQAQTLAYNGQHAEAMEKLDYALRLRPANTAYLLAKADLQNHQNQSQRLRGTHNLPQFRNLDKFLRPNKVKYCVRFSHFYPQKLVDKAPHRPQFLRLLQRQQSRQS